MGYTKIAGMPVITGLYTILIPSFLYAIFCSSRHLVVGADSATAAILAAGLVGVALAVLVVLIGSKKISNKIPGGLIAVVGTIIISWAMNLGQYMHVLGTVPSGLPHLSYPRWTGAWS